MAEAVTGRAGTGSGSLRSVGRDGSLNLIGAVCQQGSLLVVTALIARVLGEQALGRYVLAYAVLSLLALFSLLGFRAALNRFVTMHLADDEPERVRPLVRFAMLTSGGVSLALGGALVGAARPLADAFGDPGLATGFVCVGLALPALTVRDLCLAATQGWRSQRAFALIGWIYEPLARLALTGILLAAGVGVTGAFVALLVGSWTAALAAVLALRRRLAAPTSVRPRVERRAVMSFAVVTWGTTLAASGLIWVDTLLLGALADTEAVGTYTVATRLVSLAVFVMAPIDALFAPHFAHYFHSGERTRLASAYAAATGWTLRLSLPAFVVVVVFAEPLLRFFGPGFATGASVTVVLAVGQLVNAATGPCGSVLTMSGRTRLNLVNNVAGLALNIVLNLVLIPAYGLIGAAVAWSVSLTALNLVKVLQVRVLLAITPFDVVTLKSVVAALGAAVVAVAFRWLLPGSTGAAIGAAVVVYAAYAGLTLLLRFSPDEVETSRGILRGRSPAAP